MLESEHRFSAEIFNVASGKGYSVPELYSTMSRIAGKEIQPIYKDPVAFWDQYPSLYAGTYPLSRERVAKEVYKNAVGSGEKALKIFNWMPSVDIESGLRSVYQYADRKLIES
jgi:nucleoside-diphosphate-sugar epimerase